MMNKIIPYGRHNVTQADIDAVISVLRSDALTQGPRIASFEKAFAEYIGAKYAVAVSNGTAALHLCALVMDVKPGNKVITTPITFAASANCVRYCGGEVVFADIDPETYLIDINYVEKLLRESPKGTYQGIIPVDFAGRPVDLQKLRVLADEYDCWIIEDACHAPGGYFTDSKGKKHNCGNGEFADLAIFSFHPVKHIAAGEGGMITTNNEILYKKLKNLRTHGIQQDPELKIFNHGGWYYEMQDLGYNYRLTDIQAALGQSQLTRAASNLQRRIEIAAMYNDFFMDKNYIKGQSGKVEGHAYHLYIIEAENRLGLYNYLRKHGIYTQVHYIPVHLMPYYRNLGCNKVSLHNSENYYINCLSIPNYPALTNEEVLFIQDTIHEFYV